jgi:peptide/nickel transport system substrate-binding protein
MSRKRSLLAGIAVVGLLLAGCTSQPSDSLSKEASPGLLAVADDSIHSSGTFGIDLDSDPVEAHGMDPRYAELARSWQILSFSYETLLKMDQNFKLQPGLAKSWKMVSPTEYVFELRDDAVFSNGRPMTAQDVKGSLESLLASGSTWSLQLGPVSSVEVTGKLEVTVKLSSPYSPFLGALVNTPAAILPMKEILDGSVDITKETVGTGPFVATSHVQDQSWVFERNRHFHSPEQLGIDTIKVKVVADEANRLAALREGSVQYAFFSNSDAFDLLNGTPNVKALNQQSTDFYYLILNSTNPNSPLADERVRFAVNAAIKRAQLSDLTLSGYGKPTGVTPEALPDACTFKDLPSQQLSDDAIRKLLAEAGAKNITLKFQVWNSEGTPAKMAQVIQQQLKPFGINIDIETVDDATYYSTFYNGKGTAAADIGLSYFAGYGDAAMVTRWWNSDVTKFTSRFMSSTPKINQLIVDASKEPTGPERAKTLDALCTEVDRNAELVPLLTRPSVLAYRTDQLSPTFGTTEGYNNPLRFLNNFRLINKG